MVREGYPLVEGETLPVEVNDWRLVKLTGWTFDEIDRAAAVRSDWLLQIDDVMLAPIEEEED